MITKTRYKKELFNKLMKAHTVKDVNNIIKLIKSEIKWVPVGGKDNNLGIIQMGSDPAAALTERITNGLDAILEREWMEQKGEKKHITSPRKAVHEWFNLNGGYLRSIGGKEEISNNKFVKELSSKLVVSMYDSEDPKRPTFFIRDKGIGIKGSDFKNTILSLNEGRKINKLFLTGAYGQGGSTTISFSEYTIIISRTKVNNNYSNVAFTIVRYNNGDIERDKHGNYQYCVLKSTGNPIELDIDIKDFEQGTLIKHVAMNIGKYYGVLTTQQNSLYYLTHHYLFNPVLPFQIEENRQGKNKTKRTVTGNNRLLMYNNSVTYKNEAEYTFKNGLIKVYWWVLDDMKKDKIKQYTLPSKPIIITYNGQKQGELSNNVIKNELNLPYIDKNLIVEIECDRLDGESRRALFSSTREKLREGNVFLDLKETLLDILKSDDRLKEINEQIKQKFLTSNVEDITNNIRKKLSKRVNKFINSSLSGSGSGNIGSEQGNGGDTVAPKEPILVKEPPTFLTITTTDSPKKVHFGKNFSIKFITDADPSYFKSLDHYNVDIKPINKAHYSGSTNIVDGYGIVYFNIDSKTQIDDYFNVSLSLKINENEVLTDNCDILVIDEPEKGEKGNQRSKVPNINPIPVNKEHPYYISSNWNEDSVSSVAENDESIEIFVSMENKNLSRILRRAQQYGSNAVDNIKNFYLEHISYHSFTTSYSLKDTSMENSDDIYDKELKRVSETLVGIMEDTFELLTNK